MLFLTLSSENCHIFQVGNGHAIDKFGQTVFTFDGPTEGKQYNLSATTVNIKSDLGATKGELTIELIMFNENGSITVPSGEEYDIEDGSIKFNIYLR